MKPLQRIASSIGIVLLFGWAIYCNIHSQPKSEPAKVDLQAAAVSPTPTPTLTLGTPASVPASATPTNADPALDPWSESSAEAWKQADLYEFALDAGNAQFALLGGNLSHFRYEVKATQPVNVLVILEYQIHEIRTRQMAGEAVNLSQLFSEAAFQASLPCFSAKVLKSQTNCRVLDDQVAAILILDTRDPGKLPLQAAGALLGMREPLKNALKQNRVSITLYEWGDHQMQVGPWVSVEAPK